MNRIYFLVLFLGMAIQDCVAQEAEMVAAANHFISVLQKDQKTKAVYPFESDERYSFHFFPIEDRKGISFNELAAEQKQAALALLKTGLSEEAYQKSMQIMQLETILKALEHRPEGDHFRDPGKYFIIIFGVPGSNTTWGWRVEGHHVSFNFSSGNGKLVSGTPGFLGSNPGIVQDGPEKGKQILKDEANMGFELLHSFSPEQLKKVLVDTTAPKEIITFISRKAMIEHPAGILYADMNASQKQELLSLVGLYVHRYTKLFADDMLKEIQSAGLDQLRFAWAGAQQPAIGKPHYYRIQGPTIIIEYDNSQNNANHVHSVVRDLLHDFGGDELEKHYQSAHQ